LGKYVKVERNSEITLKSLLLSSVSPPLKSRKPLWKEEFLMEPFSKSGKAAWQDVDIFNKNLIEDPTKQLPGFDLPRKIWCKLNRTGHGKSIICCFTGTFVKSECGAEKETIQHENVPLLNSSKETTSTYRNALKLQQIKNL
jgi:hypothetical protein